ncbi:protein mono-ADP-ribosyltransferase PARP14-like [Colossoma macropomum]|uniref:protein mono-ADP-ribosyltransferase PARP14-like n=1 Tax=Colossoma macropomum TaxID=42526 RepID=UPI0018656385|nr:protein mono-ADP-ribosyltransferase PARP14-like [Colossoma macropomum]
MEDFPHPLTVEARWPSTSNKTLTAKLQIYFQSKKKSQGGDCVVRFPEESSAATVLFRSARARDQVLAKGDHSVTIGDQVVKLKVFKPGDEEDADGAAGTRSEVAVNFQQSVPGQRALSVRVNNVPADAVTDEDILELCFEKWGGPIEAISSIPAEQAAIITFQSPDAVQRVLDRTDLKILGVSVSVHPNFGPDESQSEPPTEKLPKDSLRNPPRSGAVVLEKLPDDMSGEVLVLLIENISGVSDEEFFLELIRGSNVAVVTFNDPNVAEKFLTESRSSKKFQQYGLRSRALEKSRSVKVENIPGQVFADLLELYFEKWAGAVEKVTMIPEKHSAIVTFSCSTVKRVLDRTDLKILKVSVSVHPYFGPDESQSEPPTGEPPKDPPRSSAVVLEKLTDDLSREVLVLLMENISGVSEEEFFLELIRELNVAVVTFNDHKVAEKFFMESKSSKKFQQYGLIGRPLEKSRSVKMENLPGQTSTDLLELYFEKWGGAVETITMIPDEQAAIVTFQNEEGIKRILEKDHRIGRTPINIYPYFISLGTALYGKDRPTWTLPKPFREKIHPAIREFLNKKGLISSICQEMISLFCHVNMDKAEVQLSPLLTLSKQKGITKRQIIDTWKKNATDGFRKILSSYAVFEYAVIPSVWFAVEKDIRSIVKDKAFMKMDDGVLTLAGMAQDINLLKPILENVLKRASDQMERDQNSVSESIEMSPSMVSLLLQEGLQQNAAAKYPELKLTYKKDTNQLTLCGLSMEIIDIKRWILERRLRLKQKPLKMDPSLLEFLRSVDCEEMSGDLFITKGISAVYTVENGDVVLTGSTDRALTEAEQRLQMALTSNILSLEDLSVLEKPEWRSLNDRMCDTYNLARKKTVVIKPSKHNDTVVVTGFQQPVLEVSRSLEKFINTHSRIEEVLHVKSCAVVKFINEKKSPVWKRLVKPNEVRVQFDPKRPLIRLSGERVHVQPAMENFQKIADALHTDRLTIEKAGAKKYFQEQGSMFLMMMKEHRFVVVLEESPGSTTKEEHAIKQQCPKISPVAKFSSFSRIFDSMASYFDNSPEARRPFHSEDEDFVMASEEFEPAVFQLCAETQQDLNEARELIHSFIIKEQTSSSIRDSAINFFSREDSEMLTNLQSELTVSIQLDKNGPEPVITVEGLTRDVVKAESAIRDMIRKVEKNEARKREAFMISSLVEWQYLDRTNNLVPFDIYMNYDLEEAYGKKQPRIKIKVNNEEVEVDLTQRVAYLRNRRIELKRVDRKDQPSLALPSHWENMKGGVFVKQVQVQRGSQEYKDVENEFRRTGLANQILNIERVQNSTLWRSYMIQKKHFEEKNKHKNNEKRLFHGTGPDNIDKINHRGFNRSYAGMHGAMYGNGVYFAVDPSYSARGYSRPDQFGRKRMYLARVLVGDYTRGRAGLISPPPKSFIATDLYDSVTDNQQNPSMFVIFHDVQAYPEYLITFQ